MIEITNINTGERLWFSARTPYGAMQKLKYYLNLSKKEDAPINKTNSGTFLWITHRDETWCVNNMER